MRQAARFSIEFDGDGRARRNTGSQAKERTEPDAVANTKDERIRHAPRKETQRAVLSAQEIVSEI